ncbi:MAG: MmcQ/YjbR family DNA-binding protein [Myxococcota bacterium]
MTRDEFNGFCDSLTGTSNVVQWGGASVWKVGGKIFAICSAWGKGDHTKISFKCSDLAYTVLTDQPGIVPAPYLARAKWVQVEDPTVLGDADLRDYIGAAHALVASKLTRKARKDLGL